MTRMLRWVSRLSEGIAAMALAAIFVIFLLQIFTRYAPKIAWLMPIPPISAWMNTLEPMGWTVNLISLLWVWIIFFSCAFFVRNRDHVAFDILFQSAPPRGRMVLTAIGAIIVVATMLYSFAPTWDAIMASRLMELKKLQTLRMPITGDKIAVKYLFASYILLMIALILRSLWTLLFILRGVPDPSPDAQFLDVDASDKENLNEH